MSEEFEFPEDNRTLGDFVKHEYKLATTTKRWGALYTGGGIAAGVTRYMRSKNPVLALTEGVAATVLAPAMIGSFKWGRTRLSVYLDNRQSEREEKSGKPHYSAFE